MIVDGFIALAKIIGEERTGIYVPITPVYCQKLNCFLNVGKKLVTNILSAEFWLQKRAVVLEKVQSHFLLGALATYVRSELRPSLILSILFQLTGDKEAMVREAVRNT